MSYNRVFLALAVSGALADAPGAAAGESRAPEGRAAQVIAVEVTGDGFVPPRATVRVGRPVKLVVTRKVERTCATEIVVKEYGVERPLPLDKPVEVTLTPRKPGPIRYACAMDMIAGELVAE